MKKLTLVLLVAPFFCFSQKLVTQEVNDTLTVLTFSSPEKHTFYISNGFKIVDSLKIKGEQKFRLNPKEMNFFYVENMLFVFSNQHEFIDFETYEDLEMYNNALRDQEDVIYRQDDW